MSGGSDPHATDASAAAPTAYRVTVSYPFPGDRPSEQALADLESRPDAVAPDANARVALSATTLDVALTVHRLLGGRRHHRRGDDGRCGHG
jgi:hypothetical protein